MINAKYLAKEYMEEIKISTNDEIKTIIDSYNRLNNIGIKMTNFQLFAETIVKLVIVVLIFAIR